MRDQNRAPLWTYPVAILLPLAGMQLQRLIATNLGGSPGAFVLEYPAVFLVVWFGGFGPGLVATLVASGAALIQFLAAPGMLPTPGNLVTLAVFILVGILFSFLIPVAQERLRELDHDFLALLERTGDFIYFKDKNSRIRFCSQAMAELCGFSDWRELIGKHDSEIFPAETAQIYMEEELPVFREGKPLLNKIDPYIARNGERRWVSTNKWPVFGADGTTVVGIFGISRDITERKRAEEELRAFAADLAEADRLKDIFTDVLRHDILTPVSSIKLTTELLTKWETDPTKVELLKKLQQSALNIEEMTVNAAKLAAVSNDQTPEFVPADPVAILHSVLPDFEHKLHEKEIALDDHSRESFVAHTHPMLKDVMANLISNAIKYSPTGTHIQIGAEDCGDDTWLLWVADEGAGVPDEHKEKIFNRFERLNKEGVKGSGLGLTITKQIVTLHGGKIWVEDNPAGAGSRFLARFPKLPPGSPAPSPAHHEGADVVGVTLQIAHDEAADTRRPPDRTRP